MYRRSLIHYRYGGGSAHIKDDGRQGILLPQQRHLPAKISFPRVSASGMARVKPTFGARGNDVGHRFPSGAVPLGTNTGTNNRHHGADAPPRLPREKSTLSRAKSAITQGGDSPPPGNLLRCPGDRACATGSSPSGQAENDIGVAYINGQQHAASPPYFFLPTAMSREITGASTTFTPISSRKLPPARPRTMYAPALS